MSIKNQILEVTVLKTNVLTLVALTLGGLSITQQIMFWFGLVAVITSIAVNIYGIVAKRADIKKNEAVKELAETQLKELNER